MDCTIHRHLLEAYLDGELGFERTLEVEAHLASCRVCSSEVQSWKDIRTTMKGAELYHRAPAHLEGQLRKLLPQTQTEQTSWFQGWIWAAGGAAFATAVLLISFVAMRPAGPSPAQNIVASHIRSMMADHLMDVVSTDQHTVKPWFDGKLDFIPPVGDFSQEGFPLLGGRLDVIEGRNVAALVYGRRKHLINLFVWPEGKEPNVSSESSRQGYNWLSWRAGDMQFCLVSDVSAADLRELQQLVQH